MNADSGGTQAPRFTNLQLRVMSAIVMVAAAIAVTWAGGIWFRLFAAAIALASLHEWLRITGMRAGAMPGVAVVATVIACVALTLAGIAPQWPVALAAAAALALGLVAARGGSHAPAIVAGAVLHCALPAAALAGLRSDTTAGLYAILFLYAVVWSTDIMAYFTGRAIGGPKLAPSISPGKTWSGAVGGTLAGVAAGAAFAWALGARSAVLAAALALLLSVAGQIGDLYESALKRRFGVKDSGHSIPGHGGVLDRVDALVFAAVVLYLIAWAASGSAWPAGWLFAA